MEQVPSKSSPEKNPAEKSSGVFSYARKPLHKISTRAVFVVGMAVFLVGSLVFVVPFIGGLTIPQSLKEEVIPPLPEDEGEAEIVSPSPYHAAYGVVEQISDTELRVRVKVDDVETLFIFTILPDTEFEIFSFADDNDTVGRSDVLSRADIQLGDHVAVYVEDALDVALTQELRKVIKMK